MVDAIGSWSRHARTFFSVVILLFATFFYFILYLFNRRFSELSQGCAWVRVDARVLQERGHLSPVSCRRGIIRPTTMQGRTTMGSRSVGSLVRLSVD